MSILRQQRDSINDEAREGSKKRDLLHKQIASLREEAEKAKKIRDEMNSKVKEFKQQRDGMKFEISERRKVYAKLLGEAEKLGRYVPSSEIAAKKQFKELEWKLQTTRLSVKEERSLIEQVKKLEEQLVVHKRIRERKDKLFDLKPEIESLKLKMNICHSKLSKLAEGSQQNHKKVSDTFKKINELRNEADKIQQIIFENKIKANEFHGRYIEIMQQKNEIVSQLKVLQDETQTERDKKAIECKEEIEKLAEEKLRNGNKLTFEEFKLLVEKGKI
ncbi:MAG: hypothetical protein ABIH76_01805 [Candidatus Bathyarchaeota archaeon]